MEKSCYRRSSDGVSKPNWTMMPITFFPRGKVPHGQSDKQKLQEKVAPSRSAWPNFARTHEDSVPV